ncbi:hypothetical protein D7B24_008781 [Verticillium nonalfalfae]|uniref:Uncharacterized protein n=1 Tax=Verticillium nonalfalfae TaxID=1051616 RepID=A0A3M9Y8C3_9PEZI|nr:uncharacterized protein D7B24_008781 [Verticillium nonalfalfae]RNJ55350.1 hypothetical protein D7B24_008781 [Verticillium nonalfalfae]
MPGPLFLVLTPGNKRGKSTQTERSKKKGNLGGQIVEELSLPSIIVRALFRAE